MSDASVAIGGGPLQFPIELSVSLLYPDYRLGLAGRRLSRGCELRGIPLPRPTDTLWGACFRQIHDLRVTVTAPVIWCGTAPRNRIRMPEIE